MGSHEVQLMIERTVKCRVSATTFGVFRVDKAAKEEGAPRTRRKAASTIEHIHRVLVAYQMEARDVLRNLGMLYRGEDGWYILPHAHINEFAAQFTTIKKEFQLQLNELHQLSASTLGETVNAIEHMVSAEQLVKAYTLNFKLHDYPACAFTGMAPERSQVLASRVRSELAGVVADCRLMAVQRLTEPVLRLIARITALNDRHEAVLRGEDVGKTGALRENAVTMLQDAIKRLPAFNFSDDPSIAALYNDGVDILAIKAADLRASPEGRAGALELCNSYHAKIQRTLVTLTHTG